MENTLILSDVDGTIINNSLILEHGKFLEHKGVITFTNTEVDFRNSEDMGIFIEEYLDFLEGKTEGELLLDEFDSDWMLENLQYVPFVIEEIEKNEGTTLLISGSPDFLVKLFVDALEEKTGKWGGIQSISSIFFKNSEEEFTGNYFGLYSTESKKSVVDSLELSKEVEIKGFGDSENDFPLLEKAKVGYLVCPTNELYKKTNRDLKTQIYILWER